MINLVDGTGKTKREKYPYTRGEEAICPAAMKIKA